MKHSRDSKIYYGSKRKASIVFIIGLLWAMLFTYLFLMGHEKDTSTLIEFVCVCSLGILSMLLGLVLYLVSNKSYIRLDNRGFEVHSLMGSERYEWKHVKEFIMFASWEWGYVSYLIQFKSDLKTHKRLLLGHTKLLCNIYNISTYDLLELLMEYKRNFG
jgi:hypothetical protein